MKKKSIKIVVKGLKKLEIDKKKKPISSLLNTKNYPILDFINREWIITTFNGFPHSEIAFLNRLWTDRTLLDSVFAKAPSRNLKALIIKLYSYNDNCSWCQEAICQFQPAFQERIQTGFGINIPVYFIGINNTCWCTNEYCIYDGENCNKSDLKTGSDIKTYLKKGQKWEDLPLSQYVLSYSSFFPSGEKFKTYEGEIRLTPENKNPFLIQKLKLTTLNGIKDQMKEHFTEEYCD